MSKPKSINATSVKEKPSIELEASLQEQILQLHYLTTGVEWSGVLFYKEVESKQFDLTSPKTMKFRGIAMHLMDIGTSASTEFNYNASVVKFIEETPKVKGCRMGLIHSHHSMTAFMSGVDEQELRKNCRTYDYYLSLIVNHAGPYVCKVAIPIQQYQFKNHAGKLVSLNCSILEDAPTLILDTSVSILVNSSFLDRINEMNVSRKPKPYTANYRNDYNQTPYQYGYSKKGLQYPKPPSTYYPLPHQSPTPTLFSVDSEEDIPVVEQDEREITDFLIQVLSLGHRQNGDTSLRTELLTAFNDFGTSLATTSSYIKDLSKHLDNQCLIYEQQHTLVAEELYNFMEFCVSTLEFEIDELIPTKEKEDFFADLLFTFNDALNFNYNPTNNSTPSTKTHEQKQQYPDFSKPNGYDDDFHLY